MAAVTALVTGGPRCVRGQSALDGFDPNANGTINVVVVQPDGKILIGGGFTALSPNGGASVARNHIARLNPDGTLDTAFNPNPDGNVNSIALQADGKILAGGDFMSIGGQTRNFIARLDATTGLADSFHPNALDVVLSIAVQTDGKILVAGGFLNEFTRLNSDGTVDTSFSPNVNNPVFSIALQADGKILVGGIFTNIGGQTRNHIARLNANGSLDTTFNPNANNYVSSIAVQADGKILAGGVFSNIGGQTRNRIARLDATTGFADSFDPNANGAVYSIALQADGKILAGGAFNGANSIGGQTRNRIARLDATTGLADSFDPNANSDVSSIAVQADGKILAGGFFTTLAPNGGAAVTRNRIARLETDGRLDQTLNLNIAGTAPFVYATAIQPDGKILIGGRFSSVLGVTRESIARVNTDGTLDMAFNPNANLYVNSFAVQPDGKILVGGLFTSIGGQARNHIARLDRTTGLADSFNPNANGNVFSLASQADGKILAGGAFNTSAGAITIGGETRNYIARLDATTGLADSFDPNASYYVLSIAAQVGGKILPGGVFTTIGGQSRNYLARIDAATGLADSFNPSPNDQVNAIAVQENGKVLVGGFFSAIGGQTRNRIARLDATTGLADSFDPNASANAAGFVSSIAVQADGMILVGGDFNRIGGQMRKNIARLDGSSGLADSFDPQPNDFVEAIALQTDGKILTGGAFTAIGGQTRNHFSRLSNGTAALQNLGVTPSSTTWTRGGSSPQLARVTFEYSTDNVNYTLLGNGTTTGSDWTLTGLSFPIGQNFYIRARGYYRGGFTDGSESITESVRNAFITLPPTPTQVVSRKIHGGAGTFDINLPLTGNPGIECRSGGASNNHQVVFNFPSAVTFTNAAVSAGAGSVSSSSGSGTTTLTVNLTGVTNAQKIMVTLQGASDGTNTADLSVQMGVLLGDVTGNGSVNSTDISQTKLQSGQPVTNANFREDVNANGSINATDVSSVKLKSGTSLP